MDLRRKDVRPSPLAPSLDPFPFLRGSRLQRVLCLVELGLIAPNQAKDLWLELAVSIGLTGRKRLLLSLERARLKDRNPLND